MLRRWHEKRSNVRHLRYHRCHNNTRSTHQINRQGNHRSHT